MLARSFSSLLLASVLLLMFLLKIACPLTGPVKVMLDPSGNQYYFNILVSNHKVGIARVEAKVWRFPCLHTLVLIFCLLNLAVF